MATKCTCDVGPGKFEGEPALTFMAYQQMLLGNSDLSVGRYDFFKAPFNFDADASVVEEAKAYGYCEECIEERSNAYGLLIYEDDNGFVYCNVFETEKEYEAALTEAEEIESEECEEYA